MNGYLLDTHTLLWAISEPARLGPLAIEIIEDRRNRLLVSAASAWEINTKARIGKLPGADAWLSTLDRQVDRLQASVLPISWEHATLSGRLDWPHRDPFDRMLAAQSLLESLTLLTADKAFQELPGLRTCW